VPMLWLGESFHLAKRLLIEGDDPSNILVVNKRSEPKKIQVAEPSVRIAQWPESLGAHSFRLDLKVHVMTNNMGAAEQPGRPSSPNRSWDREFGKRPHMTSLLYN
jgi:hypothetical protein